MAGRVEPLPAVAPTYLAAFTRMLRAETLAELERAKDDMAAALPHLIPIGGFTDEPEAGR